MKYLVKLIVNSYWWFIHLFGCPEKYLTERNTIRYCHKCFRFRFANKEVEEVFNRIKLIKVNNDSKK